MPTAAIKFTQGINTDDPGRALVGTFGQPVLCQNGDDSDVRFWQWTIVDSPAGSAVPKNTVISIGASATFDPDLRGGYLVELVTTSYSGRTAVDRRVFQVPEASGRLIPPFKAEDAALNFGGESRGWAPIMEAWLHTVDAGGGGSGVSLQDEGAPLPMNPYGTIDVVGPYISIADVGGGVARITQVAQPDVDAVVFDSGPTTENVRADRSANQSAIDNSKDGIVCLGSDTSGVAPGATGNYSGVLSGDQNSATADHAVAVGGLGNLASGQYAHVEGHANIASGSASHAEGDSNLASGVGAHAEGGLGTTASGDYSHAEGASSVASGTASHAENGGVATGSYSHAEGNGEADGNYSHVEGQGTSTSVTAQRAHAEGWNTTVNGIAGHAEGLNTVADGDYSHAEGQNSQATANAAHAEGRDNVASGDYSHAEGQNNAASGNNSHVEGSNSQATADSAHAEGQGTSATSVGAHAEGVGSSTVSGDGPHAEGRLTVAEGNGAHAEGINSQASNDAAHAGGFAAKAFLFGQYTHSSAGDYFGPVGGAQYTRVEFANQSVNGATVNVWNVNAQDFFTQTSPSRAYGMRVRVLAFRADAPGTPWQEVHEVVFHDPGTGAVIDNDATDATASFAGGNAYALAIVASGSSIQLQFTGTVGETVNVVGIIEGAEVIGP